MKTRSVFVVTFIVFALAAVIGLLGVHIVATMRDNTNVIDDHRALRAAEAALFSQKSRLSATVRDNAVWDDAYKAVGAPGAEDWIYGNWGKTSADYPLYDAVVVTSPSGVPVAAYWKGQSFEPMSRFGEQFQDHVQLANRPGSDAIVSFIKVGSEAAIVASQAIQPFSLSDPSVASPLPAAGQYNVLSFVKLLTPRTVASIATEYQLEGLRISAERPRGMLAVALAGFASQPVAFLAWPSKAPGTQVFREVYPFVAACFLLVILFLLCVLFAGSMEARRMRKLASHARMQATHDSLSGFLNRLGLMDELQRLLHDTTDHPPIHLHLVDLDGFKPVNDAWGHAVGDRLLVMVSNGLNTAHPELRALARIGGDEFALVQIGRTSPERVASAILEVFRRPFQIDGRTIEVGASIGIADGHSLQGVQDPHELLRRADVSLYEAKASGRGRFFVYDRALDQERERVSELEAELRRAIAEEAIEPLFQPLVSASTGVLAGVEALARWRRKGMEISPEVFIPLAEKSGLIDPLGLLMLRKAVRAMQRWPALTLSVNVSPLQLCNPSFATEVMALLEEEAFQPCRLVLEITEGVLISNPDQAKRAIDALKKAGVRFALDDFGCGYASIGALRQFGFDRMKIDRSLVVAADKDEAGVEVLKATIALAVALGIPVTAEGIETGRQAAVLRDAGCDMLQGYLIGRPMTGEDLARLAAKSAKVA
ncbi:MAG: EAL domain-containing protein [Neorhizobium sp.]|nr:EAL domain-containing protein [Neorhizobium sp.]